MNCHSDYWLISDSFTAEAELVHRWRQQKFLTPCKGVMVGSTKARASHRSRELLVAAHALRDLSFSLIRVQH